LRAVTLRSLLFPLLLLPLAARAQAPPADPADSAVAAFARLEGAERFFTPSPQASPGRTWAVGGTIGGLYAGSAVLLYQAWYRDYPLGGFRFFNDNAEWLQMDKGGHMFSGYFQTVWAHGLFRWAGQPRGKALGYAVLTSTVIQGTIEVFDGFSQEWGFSWGDIAANAAGAGLAAGQYALWDEQRVHLKFGFGPTDYAGLGDPALTARAEALYGTSAPERLLKDYNGLSYWLSASPAAFAGGDTWWPEWLAVSVGYGAEGLYGGFANHWCADGSSRPEDCAPDDLVTRYDVPRQRQYLLSLDLDLTRIETRKPWVRTLLGVLNTVKVPAPALEWREGEGLRGHWLYF
jgi:hypothetical protein